MGVWPLTSKILFLSSSLQTVIFKICQIICIGFEKTDDHTFKYQKNLNVLKMNVKRDSLLLVN